MIIKVRQFPENIKYSGKILEKDYIEFINSGTIYSINFPENITINIISGKENIFKSFPER